MDTVVVAYLCGSPLGTPPNLENIQNGIHPDLCFTGEFTFRDAFKFASEQ